MLKTFLQELKKQKLHTAETRLVALSCVLVGFFLPDKKLAFFFLAAGRVSKRRESKHSLLWSCLFLSSNSLSRSLSLAELLLRRIQRIEVE